MKKDLKKWGNNINCLILQLDGNELTKHQNIICKILCLIFITIP